MITRIIISPGGVFCPTPLTGKRTSANKIEKDTDKRKFVDMTKRLTK